MRFPLTLFGFIVSGTTFTASEIIGEADLASVFSGASVGNYFFAIKKASLSVYSIGLYRAFR